ncbi:hypothetical protein DN752_19515 [Echinicola strongylocentroti]|uniref:Uncharacterized protein n=1 Tax=Echinicola strongylocentroti TaxID=1795355 RepID=A0A2Z4IM07_9BACT|nr:hypothetical protein [Echinicola strongylocentroti]AWW32152.1 hypothetical protein DN752_19515 [Echinicola strongylocentroti]
MKTLKIKQDNVVNAYQSADQEGKKLLESLFPGQFFSMEAIKTFEDLCRIAGVDPKDYECGDPFLTACNKLQLIYRVFNQGWEPDFSNLSEWKYYPWFKYNAGSGFSYYDYDFTYSDTDVGARLCTDTAEKAEYIGKTFADIYNDFLTIK